MKKTYLLAILFFAGLTILWWLDHAQIPREEERLARMSRVLGGLFDARVREIRRLEILRGDQALTFERRDGDHWQMVKPFEAAADPAVVENLIRNLIDLSRSPDVGTITENSRSYGLEPPSAVVRVVGTRSSPTARGTAIDAVLEVGDSQREVRFVRSQGEKGIEAVDGKLLSALDLPIEAWREKALLPVPTFQIVGLSVRGADSAYAAARSRTGHWILREPVVAPANDLKIENILTGLSSLRVAAGKDGYVADDVRDFSKYGLDPPDLTVTLKTTGSRDAKPVVLQFGKPVHDHPERVYAKRGDQDDVVLVDTKFLTEIPRSVKDLRVSKVTDLEPSRIVKIGIDAPAMGSNFVLKRTATGWEQLEPNTDRVDATSIKTLIETLSDLQSSELFDSNSPDDPRVSPRTMTVRVWQQGGVGPGGEAMTAEPALSLEIGRHDGLRKTVYGRLEGDSFILALPDLILKALPRNSFAFRDRKIPALNPALIKSLRVRHDGRTCEVAPSTTPGRANQWKLTSPVEGNVDMPTLSQIFASLSPLRAEEFVIQAKDGEQDRQFGLDRPSIEIAWETEAKAEAGGRLRIGSRVGRTSAFYARLDSLPMIFTLDSATVGNFESELRDRTIFSFAAGRAAKIVLRWPGRAAAFIRRSGSNQASTIWVPDPATDVAGIDVAQIPRVLSQASQLQTIKFLQYEGIIPVMTGLTPPRLTIEIHLQGDPSPRILRIGNTREGGLVYGAEGNGDRGPVFFLPAAAWNQLVESGKPEGSFPDDVFAPPSTPSGNGPR